MKFVLNGAWIERNNVISGKILSSRGSLIEVPVLKGTCLQWKNPAPCGFLIGRFLSIYDLLRDETEFFLEKKKKKYLKGGTTVRNRRVRALQTEIREMSSCFLLRTSKTAGTITEQLLNLVTWMGEG